MSNPVSFAVVGLGHIGRRHATLIAAHPAATLSAIIDILPKEALRRPEHVSAAVPLFASLSDFMANGPSVEVACICTPNGWHARQAIQLLEAGVHVVIEKPIALTAEDARKIMVTAAACGRQVFGVMQNRYSPAAAWLHQQVAGGALGRLLQVHLDCFWNRDHRYYTLSDSGAPHPWHGDDTLDGGVLFTQFAHFIDLLCWCFGEVTVRSAYLANQHHQALHRFADGGTALFTLREGALGSLNFSTAIWGQNFESSITVIGERGTIKLGGQYMNQVAYCHVEGLGMPDLPEGNPANNYGPYQGSAANHEYVIDNVVAVLRAGGRVATTAAEGMAVVQLIEDIHRAAAAAP